MTGAVCCTSQWPAKSICFSHACAANTLKLLIKVSATVTIYRGHRRTLFPSRDYTHVYYLHRNYQNNSLVLGGHTQAEVSTLAPKGVTLYCTWLPSALTTGLHRQVQQLTRFQLK